MKNSLIQILESIEGNGAFSNFGVQPFVLPGLHVDRFGEVSFPLVANEMNRLITYAQKASFGKGTSTVMDTSVRSVWEIDAQQLSFHNASWNKIIGEIIEKSKVGFSIEHGKVEASLYKLLIYEEGDFFLPHRDSEKEAGMFATLIVGLPSKHSGGELVVNHNNIEYTYDFSSKDYLYAFPFVSFYADCKHEVKPVTSGYRVCLVYNLILKETDKKYSVPDFTKKVKDMVDSLVKLKSKELNQPSVILFSHQYTPSNFSLDSLKYHDRPRAEALLKACQLAGYTSCLGLVTYYKTGELEGADYDYHHYGDSDDESDGKMGEVHEESLYIEHWAKTNHPSLGRFNITKNNLLSDTNPGNEEPIEKFQEGYTGNAGMTIEYFYHYGAVIFWKKESETGILKECSTEIQVEWLEHYTRLAIETADDSSKEKSKILLLILINNSSDYYNRLKNCNAVCEALILLRDTSLLKDSIASFLFPVFNKIDVDLWIDLIRIYTPSKFTEFFKKIRKEGADSFMAHYLDILHRLFLSDPEDKKNNIFITKELKDLPEDIKASKKHEKDKGHQIKIIYLILCLSKSAEDKPWNSSVLEAIVHNASRKYVNDVLCSALIQYFNIVTDDAIEILALQLREFCMSNLKDRIANKPNPPVTFTRYVPNGKHNQWELLRAFMASPVDRVYEYRKNQNYRDQLESMIKSSSVDLTCETIKKGTPYTLKLTKNQNSYEKSLNEWQEDVELLKMMQ